MQLSCYRSLNPLQTAEVPHRPVSNSTAPEDSLPRDALCKNAATRSLGFSQRPSDRTFNRCHWSWPWLSRNRTQLPEIEPDSTAELREPRQFICHLYATEM